MPQLTHISQAAAAARIVGKDDVIKAAERGDIELVKDHVVADAGCVHKTDSKYVCQLLALAAAAHAAAFNFLISVISGWTALIYSSCYGHLETTRFLVESGANVEAKTNEYYTP